MSDTNSCGCGGSGVVNCLPKCSERTSATPSFGKNVEPIAMGDYIKEKKAKNTIVYTTRLRPAPPAVNFSSFMNNPQRVNSGLFKKVDLRGVPVIQDMNLGSPAIMNPKNTPFYFYYILNR